MTLIQDDDVVQTLPAEAAKESLTDRIRARSVRGSTQYPDAARRCHTGECRAELAVIVP
jgi:hypothetical protein